MWLVVILPLLPQLNSIAVSTKVSISTLPKRAKQINWNQSFYTEPFDICKTFQQLNPVERARAHGVAVDTFRKCGPNIIIPYAQKYNVPAFGKLFFENEAALRKKSIIFFFWKRLKEGSQS